MVIVLTIAVSDFRKSASQVDPDDPDKLYGNLDGVQQEVPRQPMRFGLA
jgi:hypothetical protein